jgi:GAF domain-containing protein
VSESLDASDDSDGLRSILRLAMHATHASGGAVLLPSRENGAWRALAREGISAENIDAFERWIGEGICREVLMSGVPRITHRTPTGAIESWGEFASPEAAAVGIVKDGRVIGILAVIAESAPIVFDDDAVLLLASFARDAVDEVSGTIGTGPDIGDRWEKALIEVDQLMASPENLGARLRGVAESLGRTLAADFSRVFIVEPLARRLSLAATSQGAASWQPATQPLDRGFLGAMIRLGEVHIVGTFHERGERRAALICIPIQTEEPRALIVLENVPVPAESEEDIFRLLREVVMHTEELIATEEGVVAQELLYQLKMRVTDQIPQLAALPPVQRARAALELTLQNLAAEVAIWIPRDGGRPISTEPRTPRAITILGQLRWSIDRIVQWVNESGSTSVGIGAEPDEAAAPVGPAPYIGVVSPDSEGVLVAFFPPDEVTGSPAQVPVHVLLEVGHHISELCSPRFAVEAHATLALQSVAPQPEAVFDLRGFRLLTRQEWLRSRRYGHEFALTRFRLAARPCDEEQAALREFLLARKRDVDLITEPEAGTCFVLSPEVDQNPEGIRDRMLREWSEAHPQLLIEADQRVFPRDGHDESIYLEWAEEPSGSQRAA